MAHIYLVAQEKPGVYVEQPVYYRPAGELHRLYLLAAVYVVYAECLEELGYAVPVVEDKLVVVLAREYLFKVGKVFLYGLCYKVAYDVYPEAYEALASRRACGAACLVQRCEECLCLCVAVVAECFPLVVEVREGEPPFVVGVLEVHRQVADGVGCFYQEYKGVALVRCLAAARCALHYPVEVLPVGAEYSVLVVLDGGGGAFVAVSAVGVFEVRCEAGTCEVQPEEVVDELQLGYYPEALCVAVEFCEVAAPVAVSAEHVGVLLEVSLEIFAYSLLAKVSERRVADVVYKTYRLQNGAHRVVEPVYVLNAVFFYELLVEAYVFCKRCSYVHHLH